MRVQLLKKRRWFRGSNRHGYLRGGSSYMEIEYVRDHPYFRWRDVYAATRQLEINRHRSISSSHRNDHLGLTLCDQPVSPRDIEAVKEEITETEFEQAWSEAMNAREDEWLECQANFPIGTVVEAEVYMFYPQGILIDIGSRTLAVAEHRRDNPDRWSGDRVIGRVRGHWQLHQWIQLELDDA